MIQIFGFFKRGLAAVMLLLGILWLPKDIQDTEEALTPWQGVLAMIDQNTALWCLAIALIGVLFWSDGRRFVGQRKVDAVANRLAALLADRTQFTIREAACIVTQVDPLLFDSSPPAQSEAGEMLYYAREGLIRPSVMSAEQWEAMKRGLEIKGYSRDKITLDSYISKEELDTYMRPGWKSWLPVLDEQRRRRP